MGNETEEMIPDLHLEFSVDTKYDLAAMMSWGTNRSTVQRGYVNEVPVPFKVEKIDPEVTTATTSSPQSGGGVDPLILSRIKTEPVEVSNEKSGTSAEDFDSPLSPPSTSEPAGPPIVVTTEEGNLKKVKTEPSEKGRQLEAESGPYHCGSCKMQFFSPVDWENHIEWFRGFKGCFPKESGTHDYFIEPTKENDVSISRTEGQEFVRKFVCSYCEYKSQDKRRVIQHVQSQHKSLNFACAICPEKCSTIRLLKRHLDYCHNPHRKVLQCSYPDCTYSTEERYTVKIHRLVQGEKNHDCSICDFKTNHLLKLNKHIRRKHYLGERSYKCDQCSYAAKDKKQLTYHCARTHSNAPKDLICSECSYKTRHKKYLNRHMRNKHTNKNSKICPICNSRLANRSSLNRHIQQKHDDAEIHKCIKCDFTTEERGLFYSHCNEHEGLPIYSCPVCRFEASNAHFFRHHIFQNHRRVWYYCHHCDHRSSRKFSIAQHIKFKHIPNSARHQCRHCNFKAKTEESLYIHCNVEHNPNAIVFYCFHCAYSTKMKPELGQHMQTNHNFVNERKKQKQKQILPAGRQLEAESVPYHCGSCNMQFFYSVDWENHIESFRNFKGCFPKDSRTQSYFEELVKENEISISRIEGQEFSKKFVCSYCEYKSPDKRCVTQHVQSRHKNLNFACAICSKKCTTVYYLKLHLDYCHNSDRKVLQCTYPDCTYSTKDKYSFKIHHLVHSEKNHECSICGFRTNHPSRLNRHIRRRHYLAERSYKCEQCSYAGRDKEQLNAHCARKHSNAPKDLICSECSYKTRHKIYLHQHMKIKHPKENSKICPICNLRLDNQINLNKHILEKHDNIVIHKCNKCDFTTEERGLFYSHYNEHQGLPIYLCPVCSFEASNADFFRHHIFQKHRRVWYYCHYCDHKSLTKFRIAKHIFFKHIPDTARFRCSHCKFKTKTQDLLSRHCNVKHNPNAIVFYCFHCAYSTKIKPKLGQHMQTNHNFVNKRKKQKVFHEK